MHKMQTMVTDVRRVRSSVCLTHGFCARVIRCSLCQITLATCLSEHVLKNLVLIVTPCGKFLDTSLPQNVMCRAPRAHQHSWSIERRRAPSPFLWLPTSYSLAACQVSNSWLLLVGRNYWRKSVWNPIAKTCVITIPHADHTEHTNELHKVWLLNCYVRI